MITNADSGTNVEEIAEGIYRINAPLEIPGGAFSFNQYLVEDAEPLLFHTGPRRLFPLVREAVSHILPTKSSDPQLSSTHAAGHRSSSRPVAPKRPGRRSALTLRLALALVWPRQSLQRRRHINQHSLVFGADHL